MTCFCQDFMGVVDADDIFLVAELGTLSPERCSRALSSSRENCHTHFFNHQFFCGLTNLRAILSGKLRVHCTQYTEYLHHSSVLSMCTVQNNLLLYSTILYCNICFYHVLQLYVRYDFLFPHAYSLATGSFLPMESMNESILYDSGTSP